MHSSSTSQAGQARMKHLARTLTDRGMQGMRATVDDDQLVAVEAVVGVRHIQHVQRKRWGLCCCTALRKTSRWTADAEEVHPPSGISPSKEAFRGRLTASGCAHTQARVCAYMAKGAEPLRS